MNGAGITYFLRARGTDYFKIGSTRGPIERRIKQLQTGCPWKLDLHGPPLEGTGWERPIQRELTLAGYRMHGEWFHIPDGKVVFE